jgi:hypothetical protein
MDHGDKPFVVRTAAASPARGQRRERAYIATTELPPQPLHAAHTRRLSPQVAAGVVEAMAGAAGDRIPQVHVPTSLTTCRALKPRTANALHRLVPSDCDAGSIDPNTGRTAGDQAPFFAPLEPRGCAFEKRATLQQDPDIEARVGLDE